MHIVDGIVMGPTHCAYQNCENELLNARGGASCAIHEQEYGNQQYFTVLSLHGCSCCEGFGMVVNMGGNEVASGNASGDSS